MNPTDTIAINNNRQRRRQLLAILREFRDATDALPDAVVVLDACDQIKWSNPAAGRLLGLGRHQYRGRPVTDLLRDPRIKEWLNKRRQKPNGLIIDSPLDPAIKLRLRVFDYGSGNQHILLARNVTKIQQMEAMRKDFVANVSHELRTPLTVISGYLETMAMATDSEWTPIIEKVEQQSTRMKAIVEDLLTLSRADEVLAVIE